MVTLKRHHGPIAHTSEHDSIDAALIALIWDHQDGSTTVYEILEDGEVVMDHATIMKAIGL